MAWTQAHIDALDDAIRHNRLSIRDSDGKQVTYRTMDELLKARALAVREVNRATAAGRGPAIASWN